MDGQLDVLVGYLGTGRRFLDKTRGGLGSVEDEQSEEASYMLLERIYGTRCHVNFFFFVSLPSAAPSPSLSPVRLGIKMRPTR